MWHNIQCICKYLQLAWFLSFEILNRCSFINWLSIQFIQLKIKTWQIPEKDWGALHVLYFLAVESRDFSQAEKERTTCKAEQIHKITFIFTQNNNLGSFWVKVWICSALQTILSFSAWEITWLNSQQHKTRGHIEHLKRVCCISLDFFGVFFASTHPYNTR